MASEKLELIVAFDAEWPDVDATFDREFEDPGLNRLPAPVRFSRVTHADGEEL
jgi:hypothetical protein